VFSAFGLKMVLLLWLYEMLGSFFFCAAIIAPVFVVSIQQLQQITPHKK